VKSTPLSALLLFNKNGVFKLPTQALRPEGVNNLRLACQHHLEQCVGKLAVGVGVWFETGLLGNISGTGMRASDRTHRLIFAASAHARWPQLQRSVLQ
jgi:hypothetical protein